MTPEEWARLRAYYHAALNMEAEERARLLDKVRQESPERANKLEELLADQGKSTIQINDRTYFIEHLASEVPPLTAGNVLQNRFKIVSLVGTGGMGDVYKATDLVDGRPVALKTVTGNFASDPRAIKLLQSEVTLALQVSGPDVCRIHAFYPADGSQPPISFFTMEYLNGITLSDKLRISGRFPWEDVKRIAKDICAGLTVIHQEKIIHRDLKPRNVMLVERSDRQHAVVMDFGIAQTTDPPAHSEAMAGTVEFMAPEQFEGGAISPATDVFGLGVLLYELLTGTLPFPSTKPLKAVMERADPVKPVTTLVKGIPRHWDRVIAKCLAFRADQRYQSAAEVFRALSTGPLHLDNFRRDHRRLFATACSIPLAAVLWGGYVEARKLLEPPPPIPEARHWYEAGIAALHEGTYVRAVRSLQRAEELDPNYPMIHARLAEALADLDFQSDAQRELLLALPFDWRLPARDKRQLSAINATVSEKYEEGVAAYTRLLRDLPPAEQSAGNVDLGMVYERAGEIDRALALYGKAAALDPSSPAPHMHMAVLQSRLRQVGDADRGFETAGKLFTAEMNEEGEAELQYEQGYALNLSGKPADAKKLLKQALDAATTMGCIQLELRAMTQIITADYLISTDDNSPQYIEANQMAELVTRLAGDNRLDSWLADGLVRWANVQLMKGELDKAQSTVERAMWLARQSRQLRVEAYANLILASVMNQKRLPERVFGPAEGARAFFQKHGYLSSAAFSLLLTTRALRDQGKIDEAMRSGQAALESANSSGVRRLIMQSEEAMASTLAAAERFPEAIPHSQRAVSFADREADKCQESLVYENALWQAGRYEEFDTTWTSLSGSCVSTPGAQLERVSSLLSRRKYKDAMLTADAALHQIPDLDPGYRKDLEWNLHLARIHLQGGKTAVHDLESFAAPDEKPNESWARKLQIAEAELMAGVADEAQTHSEAAAGFFSVNAEYASQFRSILIAVSAAQKRGDEATYKDLSNKAIDISSKLNKNWGPDAFRIYLSRPDVQATLAQTNLQLRVPGGTL